MDNNNFNQTPNERHEEYVPPKRGSNLSLFSLIAGILGIFAGVQYSLTAIILAYINNIEAKERTGRATAGMVLGWIGVIVWLILGIVIISVFVFVPDLKELFLGILDILEENLQNALPQ